MEELNKEIKLTVELVRGVIDDGTYNQLQEHLYQLLQMKYDLLRQQLDENYQERTTKPLTIEELKAGGWWCGETNEECRQVLNSYGITTASKDWEDWNDNAPVRCSYKLKGDFYVLRSHMPIDLSGLKQILRKGDAFYWID